LLDESRLPWQRRTTLSEDAELRRIEPEGLEYDSPGHRPGNASPRPRVLLVDTVGELGAWWGTARIAFVGGSFGSRGGQNMIEPAAYGAAVCFGPNTWNFRDVVAAMLDRQAAVVVGNPDELTTFIRRCLAEPGYAAALGARAQTLVASQLGATERTLEQLIPLVDARGSRRSRAHAAA